MNTNTPAPTGVVSSTELGAVLTYTTSGHSTAITTALRDRVAMRIDKYTDALAALRSMPAEPVAWAEKAMELATDFGVCSLRLGSYERADVVFNAQKASWQTIDLRAKREDARERLRQHLFATPHTEAKPAQDAVDAFTLDQLADRQGEAVPLQPTEPVANCWQTSLGEFHNFSSMRDAASSGAACKRMGQHFRLLYTHPAPAQQPLGEAVTDRSLLERMLVAMEGVIDVADRKTDEFDALRSCVVDLTVALYAQVARPGAERRYEPHIQRRKEMNTQKHFEFAPGDEITIAPGRTVNCF